MAQLNSTQVNGKVTASVAASDPYDLTRKQEVDAGLAGKAALSHMHSSGDVTDLGAAILQAVGSWVGQLTGELDWQGLSGVLVRLDPTGGLLHAAGGLAIDSGVVSMPGHTHVSADVTDLSSVVTELLLSNLLDSPTVQWQQSDSGVAAQVVVKSQGGLLADAGGLSVDFGSGPNQAAPGNHTHAQLHDALTLGPSATLALTLQGQQLSGEVLLAEAGGLVLAHSGLAVDFGPGATQAAPGNHTHSIGTVDFGSAGVGAWLSEWLAGSNTLLVNLQNGVLQVGLALDLSTGTGHAPLGQSSSGLYVVLGSGVAQAAPGNHGHSTATETAPGFMSATDKAALDALVNAPPLTFNAPLQLSSSGVVTLPPATHAQAGYLSAADKIKLDALPSSLSVSAPLVMNASGGISLPAATRTQDGYMPAGEMATHLDMASGVRPRVTQTAWGFMDPNDKAKLDGMAVINSVTTPLTLSTGALGIPAATDTQAGYMAAADKSKLDGLAVFSSVTAPLTLTNGVLGIPAATDNQDGYMAAADKAALDALVASAASGVAMPIGGGSISGVRPPLVLTDGIISLPAASETQDGYMLAGDKRTLDQLAAMSLNSGVINTTMEFAAGLNPALAFDTSTAGNLWQVWATDSSWGVGLGSEGQSSMIFSVDNDNGASIEGNLRLGGALYVSGTQVVGYQQSAIADAAVLSGYQNPTDPYFPHANGYGFGTQQEMQNFLGQVAGVISQLNQLLAACRSHGLIAT